MLAVLHQVVRWLQCQRAESVDVLLVMSVCHKCSHGAVNGKCNSIACCTIQTSATCNSKCFTVEVNAIKKSVVTSRSSAIVYQDNPRLPHVAAMSLSSDPMPSIQ